MDKIEDGLKLYSNGQISGRQYPTDVGRIDLLALDKSGTHVVIELKAGKAIDHVLGQILGYMSHVRKNLANGKKVRGIIVADDFDERLKYAAEEIPKLRLKRYLVKFEFEEYQGVRHSEIFLELLEEEAKRLGVRSIETLTPTFDEKMIRAFARCGFILAKKDTNGDRWYSKDL